MLLNVGLLPGFRLNLPCKKSPRMENSTDPGFARSHLDPPEGASSGVQSQRRDVWGGEGLDETPPGWLGSWAIWEALLFAYVGLFHSWFSDVVVFCPSVCSFRSDSLKLKLLACLNYLFFTSFITLTVSLASYLFHPAARLFRLVLINFMSVKFAFACLLKHTEFTIKGYLPVLSSVCFIV